VKVGLCSNFGSEGKGNPKIQCCFCDKEFVGSSARIRRHLHGENTETTVEWEQLVVSDSESEDDENKTQLGERCKPF